MGCNVSIVQYRRLSINGATGNLSLGADSPVELALQLAREQDANRMKILLLGAGESGKSTVLKQIKMIWKVGGGPDNEELQKYVNAIRTNALDAIKVLLDAGKNLGIPITDAANPLIAEYACTVAKIADACNVTPTLGHEIATLWGHESVQRIFSKRDEFWNMDNTPYYLEEVERLMDSDYEPTEEDMIMTRVRTTGIVVTHCPDPPLSYEVVDVGGYVRSYTIVVSTPFYDTHMHSHSPLIRSLVDNGLSARSGSIALRM